MSDTTESANPPPAGDKPEEPSLIPSAGVSTRIKLFVIGLTIVTLLAFAVFTALLINKVVTSSTEDGPSRWNDKILVVAERLESEGLPLQAIRLYKDYLKDKELHLRKRAEISHKIGTLYLTRGKCAHALSWLYQAEAANPSAPWMAKNREAVEQCRKQLGENRQP